MLLSKIHSVSISTFNNWVMQGYEKCQQTAQYHQTNRTALFSWWLMSECSAASWTGAASAFPLIFQWQLKLYATPSERKLSYGGWLMLTDIMPTSVHLSDCCVPPSGLNLLHSESGGKEEKTFSRFILAASLQEAEHKNLERVEMSSYK